MDIGPHLDENTDNCELPGTTVIDLEKKEQDLEEQRKVKERLQLQDQAKSVAARVMSPSTARSEHQIVKTAYDPGLHLNHGLDSTIL